MARRRRGPLFWDIDLGPLRFLSPASPLFLLFLILMFLLCMCGAFACGV